MTNLKALIVAAGRGSRSGLSYPKTLHKVQGIPILLRIAALLESYDSKPTIIVSPAGNDPITDCLSRAEVNAWLVVQPQPSGMGDAVLRFLESPMYKSAEHILLVWGDIPFIMSETLNVMVKEHFTCNNDFTFVTRLVESAYTVVSRNAAGNVTGVVETREKGDKKPVSGERDIGLFIFRKEPVFSALSDDLPCKYGASSGEHGFVYVIEHLVNHGLRVVALPIASEQDLVSLNTLEDLARIETMSDLGGHKVDY
jgi:bifunctional UDP-N-acetylglucosamine pyrophosphorylase/glucosamine-1-phosphate N-acetyltransferase